MNSQLPEKVHHHMLVADELPTSNLFLTLVALCFRHAYPGDAVAGYLAHAGERSFALFVCLLHLRNRRCPTMVWSSSPTMLPRPQSV